mmetsp:Transcript_12633/g.14487  ORF Transcript_12633/g.14487 Transcript_12633/m.14487 type:complete len:113 (-) Transcript_12633:124-462(-)|eukprot:CAMPEP_0184029210 /NCGR_PEP_ID=MMETSP0955-20130417/214_1 /TAXON_ID=627963 /ORGANISM="Aplanochytrium sp, Strain PBS07" /LENGTH=112 /DNA_ID=CAMNT_0026314209 /DNA_START=171 /DNA_END=509 /DNA_ORIENTATION=-
MVKFTNPSNKNHYAEVEEVEEEYTKEVGGEVLCKADKVFKLTEYMGSSSYGTRIYVDRKYVDFSKLTKASKTTGCPLKGRASYYLLNGKEIAWSYEDVLPSATYIKDLISFY